MSASQRPCDSLGSTLRPIELDVALGELGLDLGHVAELGRADGREVLRMGEEDRPLVADPLVKLDLSLGRLGGEVGSDVVDTQGHGFLR